MTPLDEHDEDRLLRAVKTATTMTDDGMSPDEAIMKIASQEKFGEGEIKLVCAAYNTGRQTAQRKRSTGILNKFAEFPLANAASVISRLYGAKTEKTASVSDEYSRPPSWLASKPREKAAAVASAEPKPKIEGEPLDRVERALGAVQKVKQAVDETRRVKAAAEDELRACVAKVAAYFRKHASDRLPFATVEDAAKVYFGPMTAPLLDLVYKEARLREKRAEGRLSAVPQIDWRAEPYVSIELCVKTAQAILMHRKEHTAAVAELAKVKEAAVLPFAKAGVPSEQEISLLRTKDAGILGTPAVGTMIGTMLSRAVGSLPETNDSLVDKAWLDLEDPEHMNELRKIRVHSMLNHLMTDPEDPISGYQPHQVIQGFNDLAQLAPRASEQPAIIRPLLRRHLESNTQPFEAGEIANVEKSLAQTKSPTPNTSKLNDTPDKLRG